MIALLVRAIVLLSGLWLLPVLLLSAQPRHDSELRAFLTPPADCPAPCFLGVRPGETRLPEALVILGQHDWVLEHGNLFQPNHNYNLFIWRWNAAAPHWTDRQGLSFVGGSSQSKVTSTIYVQTRITRAEFLAAFGRADKYRWLMGDDIPPGHGHFEYQYQAWYADSGLLVLANGMCDSSTAHYDWPVILSFQAEPPDFAPGLRPPMTQCR